MRDGVPRSGAQAVQAGAPSCHAGGLGGAAHRPPPAPAGAGAWGAKPRAAGAGRRWQPAMGVGVRLAERSRLVSGLEACALSATRTMRVASGGNRRAAPL